MLAAQPRLILPKPVPKNKSLKFHIEFLDGKMTEVDAPVLLPPFYLIKKVSQNMPSNLNHLKGIQSSMHFNVLFDFRYKWSARNISQ